MFKVDVFQYELPFKQPFAGLKAKQGLILRLTDEDGVVGFGEVSPFLGRSKETLKDVLQSLEKMSENESDAPHIPSLSFGFETAYLTLMAASKKCRINEAILPNACTRIPVNGLLYGSEAQSLALLEEGKAKGIRTFKLKVGGRSVDEDVQFVRRISDLLPEGGQLRLDANGAWSVPEAISFCMGIQGFPIEYVEDPTSDYKEWASILEAVRIPLAIDECWGQSMSFDFFELDGIDTVIVKPSLYGDIAGCLNLASTLVRLGKNVVFTSVFESDFGCFVIGHLASTISPTLAHGLYTPSLFTKPLMKSSFDVDDGFLNLNADFSVDVSRLTKLAM